jgi:hypothetical protein
MQVLESPGKYDSYQAMPSFRRRVSLRNQSRLQALRRLIRLFQQIVQPLALTVADGR